MIYLFELKQKERNVLYCTEYTYARKQVRSHGCSSTGLARGELSTDCKKVLYSTVLMEAVERGTLRSLA
jgi:hypothetical protein